MQRPKERHYDIGVHARGKHLFFKGNAKENQKDAHTQSDRHVIDRDSILAQPDDKRMVNLLRGLLPLRDVSIGQACQQNACALGDAKIQTSERAKDYGYAVIGTFGQTEAPSVRALAARDVGRVCLMGAV